MQKNINEIFFLKLQFPYHSTTLHLGYPGLFPVLQLLDRSSFQKATQVLFSAHSRGRMSRRRIQGYLDPRLLEILEPIGKRSNSIEIYDDVKCADGSLCFRVSITQTSLQYAFTIALSMELLEEMTPKVVKQLFVELIQLFSKLYFAQCSFTGYCAEFNKKHFEGKGIYRTFFLPHFVWLQYISSKELEIQGGQSAFEKNPLLQTTPLHDGLLVEVGESPYDVFTDEGEALLVKATFSLPLVQYPSEVSY
jgi:hypothetical protein